MMLLMIDDEEDLARAFHTIYERLAPLYGYETRKETAVSWDELQNPNKELMLATCREIILERKTGGGKDATHR